MRFFESIDRLDVIAAIGEDGRRFAIRSAAIAPFEGSSQVYPFVTLRVLEMSCRFNYPSASSPWHCWTLV
jgi:hypothetical protein